MTEVRVEPATIDHCRLLAPLLRQDCLHEIEALGLEPLGALDRSLADSQQAFAVLFDGEVAAITGVLPSKPPAQEGVRIIWCLAGRAADKHPMHFLHASRALLQHFEVFSPVLLNLVHADHAKVIKWAEWLGFVVGDVVRLGPHNAPFRMAVRRKATCA